MLKDDRTRLSVEDVFSLLSERLGGYERRQQQLDLAVSIQESFTRRMPGIFEAGTGTGKSFAALVPALLSGKRVVVSSATIALQEQYINKDIPALQSILPFEINAVLVKGRGNYLGLRRWEEHLLEEAVDDRLVDWVHSTSSGDISELTFLPEFETWTEVNSDTEDCLRNKCPRFNECFYFDMRRRAEKADIIVVNHALLLADAASMGSILPQYELLIVDEAHHLPGIARDAFSARLTNRGVKVLTAKANKRVQAPQSLLRDIEIESHEFFEYMESRCVASKMRLREPVEEANHLKDSLKNLSKWLDAQDFEHLMDVDMQREKARLKAKALAGTARSYIHCLELLETCSDEWVIWAERSGPKAAKFELLAAPLDVSGMLQDYVFDKAGLESSVWMSATLATSGEDPFEYFKKMIGVNERVIQRNIASPFNYREQSLLYLPRGLPEPNDPQFGQKSWAEIERLVHVSRGRAFVLFTSYSAMNKAFDALVDVLPFPCKKQGDMSRKRLIEWFLDTPNAVLFGTASFWEGISIDGDQLSCVIIDRIPFQVPDDPVYEAQCESLQKQSNASWFTQLALPYASMRLKQGVGRLIRTNQDRGLVAILDTRLTRKSYGSRILECLPPMRMVRSLDGIDSIEDGLKVHD